MSSLLHILDITIEDFKIISIALGIVLMIVILVYIGISSVNEEKK